MDKLSFAPNDDLKTSKGKTIRILDIVDSNNIGGSIWLTDQPGAFAKLFYNLPTVEWGVYLQLFIDNPPPGVINSSGQVMVSWPEELLLRGKQLVGMVIPQTAIDWALTYPDTGRLSKNLSLMTDIKSSSLVGESAFDAKVKTLLTPAEGWYLSRLVGGGFNPLKNLSFKKIMVGGEPASIIIGNAKMMGAWPQQSLSLELNERLINWQDRLEIAINLARACEILHGGKIPYIFNIQSDNVMIYENNQVSLINIDSISLIINLVNADPESIQSVNQSNRFFGLSKLLFEILLYDMNFLFKILPPEIEKLFRQQQPTNPLEQHQSAEQWRIVLTSALKGIKSCRKQRKTHFYHSFLEECPWCNLDLSIRTRLFPDIIIHTKPSNFKFYFKCLVYLGLLLIIGWCCHLAWPYAVSIYKSVRQGVVERGNKRLQENDPTRKLPSENAPRKLPGKGGFSEDGF